MARWNLQTAVDILNWLHQYAPDKAKALEQQLDLTNQRLDYWRDVIPRIRIPRDQQTGFFEQFPGFFKLEPLDQEQYKRRTISYQEILGLQGGHTYLNIKHAAEF